MLNTLKKIPYTILQFISSYFDTIENSHDNIYIEFAIVVYAYLYY
jgi:hypothetical protein